MRRTRNSCTQLDLRAVIPTQAGAPATAQWRNLVFLLAGNPDSARSAPEPYAARPITGCAQNAHRRASIGISLKHSGHFLVVGSAGAGSFRMRAISALIGVTTKK